MVVIEPATLLRELLVTTIHQWHDRFVLVGEAESATDGLALCSRAAPELILQNLELPDGDGIELVRQVLRQQPGGRVIGLCARPDAVQIHRLHEAGGRGLVEFDQSLEILREALEEVAAGRRYFSAAAVRHQNALQRDPRAFTKFLTRREQDVLRQVLEGWTSKDIAQRLHLSPRSVETFRYRLMRKLQVRNVAGLLEFALRHGMLTGSDNGPITESAKRR